MKHASALALVLLWAAPARAELAVPPLTGPVVDEAGLLDPSAEARLAQLSEAARRERGGQGVQLQFLLVPSLEGEAIEDYSIRVAEAWKLGSREADDGILVLVSRDDRAFRIEVGGGLEGELTDAQAGRILRETMAPYFREGRFGEGLFAAAVRILSAVNALPEGTAAPRSPQQSPPGIHFSSLAIVAFVLFFLFARIFSGFGRRRRRSLWALPFLLGGGRGWGGGRRGGGGGFGGFGGGGGGWSGGGGGFSGGGASGRW